MSPFWTAFWVLFIFVPIIAMWIFGLADIFSRVDLSSLSKVLWVLLIIWLPIIGLAIYFIARPDDADFYYDDAGTEVPTVPEELALLADLHDRGKLTDEEFAAEKSRLLAAS